MANQMIDGRMAVLERVAQANRLSMVCIQEASIYIAEADGLLHALGLSRTTGQYADAAQQDAFLRGFRDGQEMLLVHATGSRAVA